MKKYQLYENKFGTYFIKNHKYYYLSDFEIWGLDRSIRYDKIDYKFYKVEFTTDNCIIIGKNAKTRQLEKVWC